MKITMISGEIIDGAKIKPAPANLKRQYGYQKMAHWIDRYTHAPCSVPVKKMGNGYKEVI